MSRTIITRKNKPKPKNGKKKQPAARDGAFGLDAETTVPMLEPALFLIIE